MKKILVVMSTLYNGGAERSLVNFLNELRSICCSLNGKECS